jgi:hypothetical protein
MATIEDDLNSFERDIRQYKIEYEQYFGGGKSRPPNETEWRIETLIKRYADRGANMNFSQRFRYSNLTQTFVKYRDIFRKRMKHREEGSIQRHFGAAAREIEKERAARRVEDVPERGAPAARAFSITCKDAGHEKTKVEQLYAAYRQAQEEAGEKVAALTLANFATFVQNKTEQLKKEQQAREVEYVVSVENNHARLVARVKS